MTDIDKQAAIAALGGPEKARAFIETQQDAAVDARLCALALHALEADDGRALLRQLRETIRKSLPNGKDYDPGETRAAERQWFIKEIDSLLAAGPAQIAEPAAPADADEARIAECMHRVGQAMLSMRHDWMLRVYDRDNPEDQKRKEAVESIDEAFALVRELLASAVKAEGVLRAIDEVIADRGVPERDCTLPLPQRVDNLIVELKNWRHSYGEAALLAEKAETEIRHLRAKLAEAEAEVERLRAAKAVRVHTVTQTGEHFCETQCEVRKDLRAKLAEAERKVVAARHGPDGVGDLRMNLAAAEKERDAAIAAQNAIRSSPPAAPAGEAPAGDDDTLRRFLRREDIPCGGERLLSVVADLCRRELARGER